MATRVFAVDPGYEVSAWVLLDVDRDGSATVNASSIVPNAELLDLCQPGWPRGPVIDRFVFESIEHYGMPVGREVFETCVWTGRFLQRVEDRGGQSTRIPRNKVKLHVCGSPRATDANIRMALLDRWGGKDAAIGTRKAPGPLYGVKSHLWAALALGVTYHDAHWAQKVG